MLTFVCVFERYIFRDENSGYSIFTCQANGYNEYKNQYGFLCFEGNVARYTKGMPLKITGAVVYKSNKITIKVADIEPFTDDTEIVISYLGLLAHIFHLSFMLIRNNVCLVITLENIEALVTIGFLSVLD